jgi:xanthine dehydrogenase YagS FAD-binding subunit
MQPFAYSKATTQDSALQSLAAAGGNMAIAGGTDILDLMKLGICTPARLIDINGLSLDAIDTTAGGATIGALARLNDVAHHAQIQKRFGAVSQALLASASAQIRNMATVGGNLMQRTRCPYFRETAFPCNKRTPNSGCSARDGINRGSSILGGSASCVAVHPSDLAVALVALGASIAIAGSNGNRSVLVEDFYVLPGDTPHIETVLRTDELIVAVSVPKSAAAAHSIYLKVRDRASFEFSLVSVAAALELDGKLIRSARIALGGVAPRPWRSLDAERVLVGKPAAQKSFAAAADALLDGATALRLNGFKIGMAKNAIGRALATLAGIA